MQVSEMFKRVLARYGELMREWRDAGGLHALATIFLVTLPLALVLSLAGAWLSFTREYERDTLVAKAASNLIAPAIARQENVRTCFDESLVAGTKLTADMLKGLVTGNAYDGPLTVDDGFVVELNGDQVVYPEGISDDCVDMSAQDIRDAAERSIPYECYAKTNSGLDLYIMPKNEGDGSASDTNSADTKQIEALATVARITNDYYFMDVTSRDEEYRYITDHEFIDAQVAAAEEAYEGSILVIDSSKDSLPLIVDSSRFRDIDNASELGFTPEDIDESAGYILPNDGNAYAVITAKVEGTDVVIVFLRSLFDALVHGVIRSLVPVIVIWLIFVAIATYVVSVRSFVKQRTLTEEQAARYDHNRIRNRVIAMGLTSTLLVVAVGCLSEAMGSLYTEVLNGQRSLGVLFGELKKSEQVVRKTAYNLEADWYLLYSGRIASIASAYPQLMTTENLQQFCNDISADYIMLFDSEGKEVACSKDYVGFKLGEGHGENSADFLKLQQGSAYIVHEATKGEITGLERWVIGAPIPSNGEQEKKGALLIAIEPSRMERTQSLLSLEKQVELIATDDTTFFVADAETGTITLSSNDDLTGRTVVECDLPKTSLVDGFTNFAVVDDQPSFVITKRSANLVDYYAVKDSSVFRSTPIFGIVVAVCYILALLGVVVRLLSDRTRKRFGDPSLIAEDTSLSSMDGTPVLEKFDGGDTDGGDTDGGDTDDGDTVLDKFVEQTDEAFSQWQAMTPEKRTRSVIVFTVCFTLMLVFFLELNPAHLHLTENRLIDFIIYGDWMRGPNLFALCSVLFVAASSFCAIVILKWLYNLLSSFMDRRAKTISRLIYSFLEYLILGVLIYQSFTYLGFPTSTILGSLGLGGLALTLGSRELVTDIVAGVYIVFEDQYQVGDMVEINGFRGRVQEIGVRATKIVDDSGNIKIIGNMDVKNIVNLSKYNTKCFVNVKVPTSESISRIEELLDQELPRMATGIPEIIDGPVYCGITELVNGSMTLTFMVECIEDDRNVVSRYIIHEVCQVFQREGIAIK